jgi:zinc protease
MLICIMFSASLLSCVSAPAGSGTTSAPVLQADYAYWPHEVSDIKPDAGIVYGELPNGMRYAIMRNVQPAGAVSLRFRIASGALQETEQQRGLAHFLEHMAFNGSKNVPEGEFVKLLQRKGLAFGAHTNASTSTTDTTYLLELPKNDADLIDTSLMLFREIAGNLLLDQKAIDREKGVVLSEQRTRNTPEYRAFEARWKLWYQGQRQADRLPIGLKETIQGATREQIAEYYYRNYRPERAMLVVTGDMDPAAMEALIRKTFSDWKGEGTDQPDPDLGTPVERPLTPHVIVEKNLPEDTSVNWFRPGSRDIDTLAQRIRDSRWWMANTIINRRLERIARGDNPPFISAAVGYYEERGVSNSFSLSISSRPGTWQAAIPAAEQEVRRALEHGFTAAEIQRELKEWRSSLEDAAGSASTRQTSGLASGIVSDFESCSVSTHPTQDLAIFEKYAPTLTPETVLAGLREVTGGRGPVIVLSTSEPVAGGASALASAFTGSTAVKVASPAERTAKEFPYADFGPAGKVAERKLVDDLDISLIRFANGVRLNFKHTDFDKDTISVNVRFGGGFVSLPKNRKGMYWLLPFSFTEGGLKKLTTDEMEEALAGKIVSMGASLDDDAIEFYARTNQRDLLLQMQLFAAFSKDPAYRSLGLERQLTSAEADIRQFASSPGRVLSRELSGLLRSGDPRWTFPTLKQLQSIGMKDVEEVMAPALNAAPLEIGIVGDISEEEAIRVVAATFGAFQPRPYRLTEPAGARDIRFPKGGGKFLFTHEGSADQAVAYVAWRGPDFYSDMRRARTLSLLREVIKVRLTEEFREAQGATYSPSAGSSFSSSFPGFGFISASSETRPELVANFYRTVDAVVNEIISGKLTDDVVERARTPLVKTLEKGRLGNGFWAGAVVDLQGEPRGLEAIRTQISDVRTITRQELIDAARTWLKPGERVEIRILPAARKAGEQAPATATFGK